MPTPKPAKVNPFGMLSDEKYAIDKALRPYETQIKRREALKKALRAGCPVEPDEEWTVRGETSVTVLGPCGNNQVIDYPALVKKVTAEVFATFATCTLTALEKNVAPAIIAAVVSEEQTGSRDLKTFAKDTK